MVFAEPLAILPPPDTLPASGLELTSFTVPASSITAAVTTPAMTTAATKTMINSFRVFLFFHRFFHWIFFIRCSSRLRACFNRIHYNTYARTLSRRQFRFAAPKDNAPLRNDNSLRSNDNSLRSNNNSLRSNFANAKAERESRPWGPRKIADFVGCRRQRQARRESEVWRVESGVADAEGGSNVE